MSFFLIMLTARSGSIRVDSLLSIAESNISKRDQDEEHAEPVVKTQWKHKGFWCHRTVAISLCPIPSFKLPYAACSYSCLSKNKNTVIMKITYRDL